MGRTEEEKRTIRQGELLMREMNLVQRINAHHKALLDELHSGFAELGRDMGAAGVDISRARDEYRALDGGLAGLADMSFTQEYLKAQAAQADPEVPAT